MTQHQSLERLDAEKHRGENLEGVNVLPRELLGMYDVYLLLPHGESLNPRGVHSLSCTMLHNKKQMFWSLHAVKPNTVTTSGPKNSCAYVDNLAKEGTQNLSHTPEEN